MNEVQIIPKLKEVLIEATDGNVTEEDLLKVGDNISELGLDSIIQINFLVKVEEIFNIEIDIENINHKILSSFQELKNYILEHANI
jgi:acyl carrier protein